MRVLIIEDNLKLAENLKQTLNKQGFVADYVTDGEVGLKRLNYYLIMEVVELVEK